MVSSLTALLFVLMASAGRLCNADGQRESRFDPRYLAKTKIDRVIEMD